MQQTLIARFARDAKQDGLTLNWAMRHLTEKLEQTEQRSTAMLMDLRTACYGSLFRYTAFSTAFTESACTCLNVASGVKVLGRVFLMNDHLNTRVEERIPRVCAPAGHPPTQAGAATGL